MSFAKIECVYSDASATLGVQFRLRFDGTGAGRGIFEQTWTIVSVRASAYQISAGIDAGDQGNKSYQAVLADINNSFLGNYVTVTPENDGWKVEANEYGWTFTEIQNDAGTNAAFTITPEVPPAKNFELTGYSLGQAASPCANIQVTVTENDGVAPYVWVNPSNPSTTLVADLARQATVQTISVTLQDADTDQATLNNVVLPPLFDASFITNISVVTNPGGFDASVTVFMNNPSNLFTYTYSIDGTNFQSSNVFPNVTDGNYTLYVNDGFGCLASTPFTVDTAASVQRPNPYAVIPKANPFRWVQQTTNQYQTLDNTLYRDEFYLGFYKPKWSQPYQTNDGVILTQFRTNYDERSARILDCDDNIVQTLTINKKSDNIGAQDKRDAISYNAGNNQTGIYFTSGNIYDPGTTDIIDTYELNGQLPEWGVVGNTVVLSGVITGSFVIKQVIFDDTVQANALIIDNIWTSGNQSEAVIAECTYDRLNYEVYEFEVDMSVLSGLYYVQIVLSDSLSEYPIVVYNSEEINVLTNHLHTNVVEYYDNENSGIDYSTGFQGKVRIKSLDPYAQMSPGGEKEQYNDSREETTTLKANAVIEGIFYIEGIPKGYIEKFNIIFNHVNVFVNGEKWTATEFETLPLAKNYTDSLNVTLRRNNYEEYQTDNIDVDGTKSVILQEEGNLLQ